jgi:hypothetical protein
MAYDIGVEFQGIVRSLIFQGPNLFLLLQFLECAP